MRPGTTGRGTVPAVPRYQANVNLGGCNPLAMSVRSHAMSRPFAFVAVTLLGLGLAGPASAQTDPKPAPKDARKPEAKKPDAKKPDAKKPDAKKPEGRKAEGGKPGGATLVATFADWGAYTATSGQGKICYALSEPKARSVANLKDTKAYLFVSFRPAEKVQNEIASVLNFKTKPDSAASLAVGSSTFGLVTVNENAWLATAAEEGTAIGAMSKGGSATVQTVSAKGTKVSDRYSLSGFAQALERARRDCL